MPVDKEKEKAIESQCRALIQTRKFDEAARAMEKYRAPLHDWFGDYALHLNGEVKDISIMYNIIPDQLQGINYEYLQTIREELAYTWLRGNNTIRKFMKKPTNIPGLTIGIGMKILLNRACQLRNISDWKMSRVCSGVEILNAPDLCPECKKICGRYSFTDNIPPLPNPKCMKADPCLPLMVSIIPAAEPPKKKRFGLF